MLAIYWAGPGYYGLVNGSTTVYERVNPSQSRLYLGNIPKWAALVIDETVA